MELMPLLGHPLPRSIVIQVFSKLSGGTLHKCRQVCHSWNNFILENVWGSKYGKKMIESRLEENKSVEDLKYDINKEILDIGVKNLYICASCQDHVVFMSPDSFKRRKYIDLFVYNMKTKDIWKVAKSDPLRLQVNGSIYKPQVLVNESILAVHCILQRSNQNDMIYNGVDSIKVWSMQTKELMFDEDRIEFLDMQMDNYSSLLILTFVDKNEVLSFKSDILSRYSVEIDGPPLEPNRNHIFVSPYYLYVEEQVDLYDQEDQQLEVDGNCRLFLWKVDDTNKQILLEKYVEDYHPFLHFLPDTKEWIKDVIYVFNFFIIASEWEDEENNEELLTIKVVNDSGEILTKFLFENWCCSSEFSIYEQKRLLVFNADSEVIIFSMKELLSCEANQTVFKRLQQPLLQGEDKTRPSLNHLAKTHTSLAILNVVGKEGKHLQMRKYDFWNVE